MSDETRCLKLARAWLKRGPVAIQEHEARIRAEAAAERTAAILDTLDMLASAEGDPCCASTLRRAHSFVADAFPKPGGTDGR